MKQEDKDLLLKDLCARLPYGVNFCFANSNIRPIKGIDLIVTDKGNWEYAVTAKGIEPIEIEYVKPYLRPISSMTEDEQNEFDHLRFRHDEEGWLDFVLSKHLDWRGLIEKGLALEALEGMYNIKEL